MNFDNNITFAGSNNYDIEYLPSIFSGKIDNEQLI